MYSDTFIEINEFSGNYYQSLENRILEYKILKKKLTHYHIFNRTEKEIMIQIKHLKDKELNFAQIQVDIEDIFNNLFMLLLNDADSNDIFSIEIYNEAKKIYIPPIRVRDYNVIRILKILEDNELKRDALSLNQALNIKVIIVEAPSSDR